MSPYDELDSLQRETETRATPPKEKARSSPTKTVERTPVEKPAAEEKPAELGEETPKPEVEKKPEEEVKPVRSAELRTAYEQKKARVRELEAELERVKTGTKSAEDDPERKALVTRLEQLEKELDAREARLRMASYEHSREYQDKYEVPIKRAFEAAYAEVQQLKLSDGEQTRDATPADFNAIMQMPLAQAVVAARAFGDAATEVLAHRRRILQMNQDRQQALADAHAHQEENVKAQAAAMTQRRSWWAEENKEADNKYTQWSKPDEDDPKEAEILNRATQIADLAFSDTSHLPARDQVRLHAALRNKARWFDLLAYRNQKLTERLKETESKLAEYEASTPSEETTRRESTAAEPASWESELDKLDRP